MCNYYFFPDKVAELVVGGSVINVANMFAIVHRLWVMKSDLLKANSFAQPNFLTIFFAQIECLFFFLFHVQKYKCCADYQKNCADVRPPLLELWL